MENKGLNVFNSAYVLADGRTATDTDYERILGVIGHEYFQLVYMYCIQYIVCCIRIVYIKDVGYNAYSI